MTGLTAKRLGELTWGFLNSCPSGEARDELDGAEDLDGVGAWRRVAQHIYQGTMTLKGLLRNAATHPLAFAKLGGVYSGISRSRVP